MIPKQEGWFLKKMIIKWICKVVKNDDDAFEHHDGWWKDDKSN
jgi:hypothetical protein